MRHMLRRTGKIMLVDGLTAMLVGPFLIPGPPLKGTLPPKDLDDDDRVVPTAGSIRLVDGDELESRLFL